MSSSARLAADGPAPKLSIIIPNYNHTRFLKERIASIKRQTFRDYELIVLDDASSDDSLAVLQEELAGCEHQLVVNQLNSGSPCSQWLKGIELAKGDFLWIAESDDSCPADFLATLLPYLEEGATLAYCRSAAIDAEGADISAATTYWPDRLDPDLWQQPFARSNHAFCRLLLMRANCIPNASAVVFRRDRARACLALRPQLAKLLFVGDWLFWFEYLAHQDGHLHFVAQSKSWFRNHAATTRSRGGSQALQVRHIEEYCQATRWISRHPLMAGSIPWRQQLLDDRWDWMLLEYLVRSRPSAAEILLGHGLQGPLRRLLPFRLLFSREVRVRAFPVVGGWINQRLSAWQTGRAKVLARLKRALP
jgi:glycosyltransferase involved in cell wall biosynthesis